ncbi:MAG: YtxH domain-containing protein [Cytophagaceae bacterium]|jgi:gas vesicle protein
MNNGVKIFWGFLAGAAVGTAAGLVFAPEKGSETRVKIGKKASEFGEGVATTYKKGVEKFNTLKESAFSLVNNYGEEVAGSNSGQQGGVL